jgi:hypothetical protein
MKAVRCIIAASVIVALILLSVKFAAAQTQPFQSSGTGGGMIMGTVLGFNMYYQLIPIAWAAVYANNGLHTFIAYSSTGGFYEMFVPTGLYNVTVIQPGYKAYSNVVAVSDGSSSTINFTLEQSHVPVPEFQPNVTLIVMVLTLAGALVIRRRSTKRRK